MVQLKARERTSSQYKTIASKPIIFLRSAQFKINSRCYTYIRLWVVLLLDMKPVKGHEGDFSW
jgi:hypothetical protein